MTDRSSTRSASSSNSCPVWSPSRTTTVGVLKMNSSYDDETVDVHGTRAPEGDGEEQDSTSRSSESPRWHSPSVRHRLALPHHAGSIGVVDGRVAAPTLWRRRAAFPGDGRALRRDRLPGSQRSAHDRRPGQHGARVLSDCRRSASRQPVAAASSASSIWWALRSLLGVVGRMDRARPGGAFAGALAHQRRA